MDDNRALIDNLSDCLDNLRDAYEASDNGGVKDRLSYAMGTLAATIRLFSDEQMEPRQEPKEPGLGTKVWTGLKKTIE